MAVIVANLNIKKSNHRKIITAINLLIRFLKAKHKISTVKRKVIPSI